MRQSITREMWNELSDEEKISFVEIIDLQAQIQELDKRKETRRILQCRMPTIGQMIEFLGREWYLSAGLFQVYECGNGECSCDITDILEHKYKELADALWEAVKHKLA